MTKKFVAATLAFTLVAGNAYGAARCVGPEDELAMKTSSMQQSLMVAALSCGATESYNRFVLSYRSELQQADAALLRFFRRQNGSAGEGSYHAFKTKAANVSALAAARDGGTYCANAGRLFAAAFETGDLAQFVSRQWESTGQTIRARCTADAGETSAPYYRGPVAAAPEEPSLGSAGE